MFFRKCLTKGPGKNNSGLAGLIFWPPASWLAPCRPAGGVCSSLAPRQRPNSLCHQHRIYFCTVPRAAVSSCLGTVGYTVSNLATSGTATTVNDNADDSSTANAGYVAGLSAGTNTFPSSFSGGTKACFAVALFSPPAAHPVSTVQAYGIKFLGNTTDPVTGTAGAFPISGWNNIANASYTSGTVNSSDGSGAATLGRTICTSPTDRTYWTPLADIYAQFGLRFPLNEYRAGWKMAGQPLAQRLHDKCNSSDDVQMLLPRMLTEGLVGYIFSCPDMIGGGMLGSFSNLKRGSGLGGSVGADSCLDADDAVFSPALARLGRPASRRGEQGGGDPESICLVDPQISRSVRENRRLHHSVVGGCMSSSRSG